MQNTDMSNKDCKSWRSKGKCSKHKKNICPYRHDESVRMAAIERNRQKMINDTQVNSGKKKKQSKNVNKKNQHDGRHPLGIVLLSDGQSEPKIYHTQDGKRHINPYYIVVSLPLQKYAGKTIQEAIDSISSRTKRPSKEYWLSSLQSGRLTLHENNNNSNKGYKCVAKSTHVIEKQNVLKGRYHYHEESIPSIICQKLSIVYQDDEYLVLNKPSGIDCCTNLNGGRVYNSLPGLLYTEFGCGILYPAHRIDHNVSGIVCFGKTTTAQKRLTRRIKFHEAQKTYYARVQLNPNTSVKQLQEQLPIVIDEPLGFNTDTCLATTTTHTDDDVKVKECKTTIISVTEHSSMDGTAILQVQPNTGRPHQLRKHLQHINLSIANDIRYGGKNIMTTDMTAATTTSKKNDERINSSPSSFPFDKDCSFCTSFSNDDDNQVNKSSSSNIWLHSYRYEYPSLNLTFETSIPDWAVVEQTSHQK